MQAGWSVDLRKPICAFTIFVIFAGNVYKYRAGSRTAAQQWCRYLQQAACGVKEKPLPANLMSFE
jgi:hypothetical protein